ncbi:MAG: hypothetical protein AB7N91_14475 [Candidatus Tectimicrobiota bacterium]
MPTDETRPIRPRLRKGREAKERPPGGSLLRRLQQRAGQRAAGRRLDAGRRGWRGVYVPPPGAWAQQVVVKVTVQRRGMSGHRSWTAGLRQHLDYLQREGVELGGEAGQLYTRAQTGMETTGFLARSSTDPHQFRVIVSAEEGADLDLTRFTRSVMGQVEDDLGTRLDWVAVNHYDTDHPHTHVLVRGADADGQPLMIQRSYIAQGFRSRAQEVATRELGPRRELTHKPEVARVPERTRDLSPRWEPMPARAVARAPQPTRNRGMDLDV